MSKMLYQKLASLVQAIANCEKSGNEEWLERHRATAEELVKQHMPSGSGWDVGTKIGLDACTPNRLIFAGQFHHMNEDGYYDGWTTHQIIVTADLASGFVLKINGPDRNGIKDHLYETFDQALRQVLPTPVIQPPPEDEANETCDECGNRIPEVTGGGVANKWHKESCSLYEASEE